MIRETWNEIAAELEVALLEVRAYGAAAWQSLRDSFLLPGDYITQLLSEHVPAIAGKPVLDLAANGEMYAVVLSAVVWLCVLLLILRCLQLAGRTLAGWYYSARRRAGYSEEFSINALQMDRLARRLQGQNTCLEERQWQPIHHVATRHMMR